MKIFPSWEISCMNKRLVNRDMGDWWYIIIYSKLAFFSLLVICSLIMPCRWGDKKYNRMFITYLRYVDHLRNDPSVFGPRYECWGRRRWIERGKEGKGAGERGREATGRKKEGRNGGMERDLLNPWVRIQCMRRLSDSPYTNYQAIHMLLSNEKLQPTSPWSCHTSQYNWDIFQ